MRYCGHCGLQFRANVTRNAHERKDCPRKTNDEIRCGFCGLVFKGKLKKTSNENRVKHEASRCTEKAKVVPVECADCEAIYNRDRNLDFHVQEEH